MFDRELELIWQRYIKVNYPHQAFQLSRVKYNSDQITVEIDMTYDLNMDFDGNIFTVMVEYLELLHGRLGKYFVEVNWRDQMRAAMDQWSVTLRFLDPDVFEMFNILISIKTKKDLAKLRFEDDSGKKFGFAKLVLEPILDS